MSLYKKREERIAELRAQGKTFLEIGREVGIVDSRAADIYRRMVRNVKRVRRKKALEKDVPRGGRATEALLGSGVL